MTTRHNRRFTDRKATKLAILGLRNKIQDYIYSTFEVSHWNDDNDFNERLNSNFNNYKEYYFRKYISPDSNLESDISEVYDFVVKKLVNLKKKNKNMVIRVDPEVSIGRAGGSGNQRFYNVKLDGEDEIYTFTHEHENVYSMQGNRGGIYAVDHGIIEYCVKTNYGMMGVIGGKRYEFCNDKIDKSVKLYHLADSFMMEETKFFTGHRICVYFRCYVGRL